MWSPPSSRSSTSARAQISEQAWVFLLSLSDIPGLAVLDPWAEHLLPVLCCCHGIKTQTGNHGRTGQGPTHTPGILFKFKFGEKIPQQGERSLCLWTWAGVLHPDLSFPWKHDTLLVLQNTHYKSGTEQITQIVCLRFSFINFLHWCASTEL